MHTHVKQAETHAVDDGPYVSSGPFLPSPRFKAVIIPSGCSTAKAADMMFSLLSSKYHVTSPLSAIP